MLTGGRTTCAPSNLINTLFIDNSTRSQLSVKHLQRVTPCMPCRSCHCAPLLMHGPLWQYPRSQRTESHTSSTCHGPVLPSTVKTQTVKLSRHPESLQMQMRHCRVGRRTEGGEHQVITTVRFVSQVPLHSAVLPTAIMIGNVPSLMFPGNPSVQRLPRWPPHCHPASS